MGFLVRTAGQDEHEDMSYEERRDLILDALGQPHSFDDERLKYRFLDPKQLNYAKIDSLYYKALRGHDDIDRRRGLGKEFYESNLTLHHAIKKIENDIFDTFYEWLMMDLTKLYSSEYDGPPICEGGYIYVIYEYETPLCAFTVNVWVDTEAMKKFEEFRMGADFDNLRIRKGVLPEKSEICVPANTPEKDSALFNIEYKLQREIAELNRALKDWGLDDRITYQIDTNYNRTDSDKRWYLIPPHAIHPKPMA